MVARVAHVVCEAYYHECILLQVRALSNLAQLTFVESFFKATDYNPLQQLSSSLRRLELFRTSSALPAVLPQLTLREALVIRTVGKIANSEVLGASLAALTRLTCLEVDGSIDVALPAELNALSRLQRLSWNTAFECAHAQLVPVPGGAWLRSVVSLRLPAVVLALSLQRLAMAGQLEELQLELSCSKAADAHTVLSWAAQQDSLRRLELSHLWAADLVNDALLLQRHRPSLSIEFVGRPMLPGRL